VVSFSANLGFLWTDRALPDAIRAAAAAGFAAVECHAPYKTTSADTLAALNETGLGMLSINTRRGATGEAGLTAIPGEGIAARAAIDEAIRYASAIDAKAVHAMAGNAPPQPDAFLTYLGNLRYACKQAAPHGITILIEPLNLTDNPGYYLNNIHDALGVIDAVDRPNLKLLFDCYHAQITEGDVAGLLPEVLPVLGHVQFASAPGRSEPDRGDIDYQAVFALLDDLGWAQPVGAEYRPTNTVEESLGWMQTLG